MKTQLHNMMLLLAFTAGLLTAGNVGAIPVYGNADTSSATTYSFNTTPSFSASSLGDSFMGTGSAIGFENASNIAFTSNAAPVLAAYKPDCNPVPVPGAMWLFGTALAAFLGITRRQRDQLIQPL